MEQSLAFIEKYIHYDIFLPQFHVIISGSQGPAEMGVPGVHVQPLSFWKGGNKKLLNSALQTWLLSIVYPLILAPCTGPGSLVHFV